MMVGINIARRYNVNKIILAKLFDNYGVLKEIENKLDSALYYYKMSLEIKYELNDTIGIPYSLNKLANGYALKGNFSKAFKYLTKSDFYRAKEKSDYGRADNLAYWGDLYSMQSIIDSAIVYYEASLFLSQKNNYSFLIEYCLNNLSDLYKNKKDYSKAYDYLYKHSKFKDSLMTLEREKQVSELEVSFETAMKDKMIRKQGEKIESLKILFVSMSTFIMLILIFLFIIYSFQKKRIHF